jgi:hypothetical protein
VVERDQEDELRAFVALTARRMPRGGELAWALGRFDLACERDDPRDALTDLLLALRALLEPEGADGATRTGSRAAWPRCAPSPRSAPRSPRTSCRRSTSSAGTSPVTPRRPSPWRPRSTS